MPPTNAPESVFDHPILLGKRADELSLLIERQIEPIFAELGIAIPVRSCSLMLFLEQANGASAADLAKGLGHSHQLVLQKIPVLQRRDLIERHNDPEDRRRRIFLLTEAGQEQVMLLKQSFPTIQGLYRRLEEEIGVDLFDAMGRALDALRAKDLLQRLREQDGAD